MKKSYVFVTLVVFLVTVVLIVLADVYKMESFQFWKGSLILGSLGFSFVNALKSDFTLITKHELLHVVSGLMLGASVVLFIGMCLNMV